MFGLLLHKLFGQKLKVSVPHTQGLPMTDDNKFGEDVEDAQWIGVDLDGTLAEAEPWKGFDHIGRPVPMMMKRVKIWLEMGYRVKIVTARAQNPELAVPPIREWLKKNDLPDLEITNAKDMDMIELWDDRCVQVIQNTGKPVGSNPDPYRRT
ncbi:MAG: hypothetical protein CBC16_05530 [Verrucomicrobia bacterium TMED56]|jgi:hypothetical protein|nr:MAG: hypothetical protein CBC16_05530 [Verrucomicrobia bacterium TMED56]